MLWFIDSDLQFPVTNAGCHIVILNRWMILPGYDRRQLDLSQNVVPCVQSGLT